MSTLETMVTWPRSESSVVRSLELRLPIYAVQRALHRNKEILGGYLTFFRSVGGNDEKGLSDKVQKRLLLDQREVRGRFDVEQLLKSEGLLVWLRVAFGGELWVDRNCAIRRV